MNLYHLLGTLILMAPPLLPQVASSSPVKSTYAPVNGLRKYHEIHSYEGHSGETPLIVLHGGIGSTAIFNGIMPAVSAKSDVMACGTFERLERTNIREFETSQ
jgi:hypothetical protein